MKLIHSTTVANSIYLCISPFPITKNQIAFPSCQLQGAAVQFNEWIFLVL